MVSTAVNTKTLAQAKASFMQVTEFGGATREMIGGYPVTESASKIPWMSEEEFQKLQISIHKDGLLDDVELNDAEEIVDGRNRMLACLSQDVEPTFKYAKLPEDSDTVEIRNLNRRQLTQGVRASLYLKLHGDDVIDETETEVDGDSDGATLAPVEESVSEKPKKTILEQAKEAGVGERTMQQALTVKKAAIPEVKEAVEKGEIRIDEAAKIARQPEEEQRQAVETRRAEGGSTRRTREVSEATFSIDAYMSSFGKRISKMLASVPPGVRDTVHRRMGESLGSTVRLEKDTADLMNSAGVVPYVEELVSGMAKSERAGAEKALAERYGSVVTVKDAEAAFEKMNGVFESLGDREKKKLSAMLGEQYKLPVSSKPAEYLPELPSDVNEAMDVFVKEAKHRADSLKGHSGFMSEASETIVAELEKLKKKLTLKKS